MHTEDLGLEMIQVNNTILLELPSERFSTEKLKKCSVDEPIEFTPIAAKNEVSFPKLTDHGSRDQRGFSCISPEASPHVVLKLAL